MTRHEDIERYLSEEMSGDERLAFENELKSNPALREETAFYASTAESLRRLLLADDNEQQLRKKLHPYRAEYFSAHKKDPKIRALPLIRWAAAAAIFTAIWIWSPWNTNPIREYGTITMPPLTERSADSVNGVAEAAGLFNEKEYEQALPLINKELSSQPNDMFLLFFRGVTLIHTGQATQARTDLEQVYESKSVYRYEAAYFIGLTYLEEKDKENCRIWMEKIPAETQVGKKAQPILKKLK